ncbi:MAG: hypothetical protein P4L51_04775 [Puia sp.]|nr:hypothetical protein [Puia sp.]
MILVTRIISCLPALWLFIACKHAVHRYAGNDRLPVQETGYPRSPQDSVSARLKKGFGYAWWLDDHKKHREAAELITELLGHLPKIPRKDSALKYLTLYLLALPQQQADSVAGTIEAMLDPASPSYSNDLVQFFNGKIRWLIWTRHLAEGRQLLVRCDSLIRHAPATAIDSLSRVSFWDKGRRYLYRRTSLPIVG